ncbi:MAG: PspC domain-containing protein [Bacteroidetes bacterium]|nr:PspC domain-containing protein [Bacteroidota bacterium]
MSHRLYRSTTNNLLGGVCSGLASYLNVDPVIVRVAFVLATFADGLGILAYILLMILMPRRPWHMEMQRSHEPMSVDPTTRHRSPAFWFGIGLVVIGVFAFVNELMPWIDIDVLWPVVLIALGGGLIYRSMHRSEHVTS